MEPSKIPPGTLSLSATVGTLLAAILGKFDGHPGWLCCALGIVALVAIARGATEAWKARGAALAARVPPAAVVLALLLVPTLAFASDGVKTGGITFASAYQLLLGVPALIFVLVVLAVSVQGILQRARCFTWLACALVLLVSTQARADEPPAPVAAHGPQLAPQAPPAAVEEGPKLTLPAPAAQPQQTPEGFGLCMAQGNVELAGKCTGTTAPLPPDYGKLTFRSVLASSIVGLVQIGGGLLTVWLDPNPIGK